MQIATLAIVSANLVTTLVGVGVLTVLLFWACADHLPRHFNHLKTKLPGTHSKRHLEKIPSSDTDVSLKTPTAKETLDHSSNSLDDTSSRHGSDGDQTEKERSGLYRELPSPGKRSRANTAGGSSGSGEETRLPKLELTSLNS